MSDRIDVRLGGASVSIERPEQMAMERRRGPNVSVVATDSCAVVVNGRAVTRARHDEDDNPIEYWDLAEERPQINGTALIWRFEDGTVSANINADMDVGQTRRLAARLLEASGVPVALIQDFLGLVTPGREVSP